MEYFLQKAHWSETTFCQSVWQRARDSKRAYSGSVLHAIQSECDWRHWKHTHTTAFTFKMLLPSPELAEWKRSAGTGLTVREQCALHSEPLCPVRWLHCGADYCNQDLLREEKRRTPCSFSIFALLLSDHFIRIWLSKATLNEGYNT